MLLDKSNTVWYNLISIVFSFRSTACDFVERVDYASMTSTSCTQFQAL